MSVYVDAPIYPYGRMRMCHMLADSIDELHAMADRIGVDRRHYQGPPKTSTPHYDICKAKRAVAVRHGAIEADRATIVAVRRRVRAPRSNPCVTLDRWYGQHRSRVTCRSQSR